MTKGYVKLSRKTQGGIHGNLKSGPTNCHTELIDIKLMKQKPVLERWPKPSINLRLFDSHCCHKVMDVVLNKTTAWKKWQNFVMPLLVSP